MNRSKFMNMLYDLVVLIGCLDMHKLVIHTALKFFAVLAMFSTADECRNLLISLNLTVHVNELLHP